MEEIRGRLGLLNIAQLQLIHEALVAPDWVAAANLAFAADEVDLHVEELKEADQTIRQLLKNLLDEDLYLEAAALLWSHHQFDPRPSVTQQIFKAIHENSRLLIMAGSSLSKTFSAGIFFYLDWRRDPFYTNIKLCSANEDNLRSNLYSHISAIHKTSAIPMKEDLIFRDSDLHIGIKNWLPEMGISGIAIKQGVISSGGLRGHKPKSYRKTPHPKFGYSSRVRILVDEAQDVAAAAQGDINTIEASISGLDRVKIVQSFNPVDLSRRVVEMAEPPELWNPEQLESLYNYEAKSGYQVLRLDGAHFENVVQRAEVYPNMLSYEAYMNTLKGGDNSASYYVCRGFPPMRDAADTVIPPEWLQTQRGEAIYVDKVEQVVSVDLAFQGADRAAMALGRWGLASGWRRENNATTLFMDRLSPGVKRPRHVLTIDQIFILPKSNDTVTMVQEVMGRCKTLGVDPEWVSMDRMQPISEPVLTPTGWRPIGSMAVGDEVIGSNGKPTKVTGVYPQSDRRVWKVTMSDGSWTRCGPEHLWSVLGYRSNAPKVLTTEQIKSRLVDSRGILKWIVPVLSSPVEFLSPKTMPVDPYVLGCLLGNGNLRKYGIRYSSNDPENIAEISKRLPVGVVIKKDKGKNYDYSIMSPKALFGKGGFTPGRNCLLEALRDLGLAGKLASEKYIPDIYMRSSIEDRLQLIRGLMDTDGFVNKTRGKGSCCCGIRLVAEKMILQIKEMIEGLGGICSLRSEDPSISQKRIQRAYVLTISVPNGMEIFRLSRKLNSHLPRLRPRHRKIASIDTEEDEDSVCIRVEAADHLYVTRNCILTHNTGNALGVWSHASTFWGNVLGIDWFMPSTDMKVLSGDLAAASDVYEGIPTEMWFTFKRWLDPAVCAIIINPTVPTTPLYRQLSSRRCGRVGNNRIRVESKAKYKARNGGHSPDEADALIMITHLIRNRSKVLPGIMEISTAMEEKIEALDLKRKTNGERQDTLALVERVHAPDRLELPLALADREPYED